MRSTTDVTHEARLSNQENGRDDAHRRAAVVTLPATCVNDGEAFHKPYNMLGLPQEILDKILKYVCGAPFDAEAYVYPDAADDTLWSPLSVSILVPQYPIDLVCRRIRRETDLIRKRAFSGNLTITFTSRVGWNILSRISPGIPPWLRKQVTSLNLGGFARKSLGYHKTYWKAKAWQETDFLTHFPNVQSIQLNFDVIQFKQWLSLQPDIAQVTNADTAQHLTWNTTEQYVDTEMWRIFTPPALWDAGSADQRDRMLEGPALELNAFALAAYLRDHASECKVYVKTTIQFLSNAESKIPLRQNWRRMRVTHTGLHEEVVNGMSAS